jgi:hypothetical protein
MWHKLIHNLRLSLWESTDHLAVPGYQHLYRQRCRECGATRVQDLTEKQS